MYRTGLNSHFHNGSREGTIEQPGYRTAAVPKRVNGDAPNRSNAAQVDVASQRLVPATKSLLNQPATQIGHSSSLKLEGSCTKPGRLTDNCIGACIRTRTSSERKRATCTSVGKQDQRV
jgi:hypothetical protein